jgi:hypothetical protein
MINREKRNNLSYLIIIVCSIRKCLGFEQWMKFLKKIFSGNCIVLANVNFFCVKTNELRMKLFLKNSLNRQFVSTHIVFLANYTGKFFLQVFFISMFVAKLHGGFKQLFCVVSTAL